MNIKNKLFIFLLFIVLIGSVSFISAVSTDSMDNIGSDVVSNDEFISLSSDEQAGTVDESVLSAQKEINNLSVNNDENSMGVTNQETNMYLEDIRTSTSDEYYEFVNYLITQKGFKFNTKSTDDGYTIYSTSNYQSKLYDGENYVLPAGTQYFISKDRISYVLDEYYLDVYYFKNNDVYIDELYLGWLKNVENYHYVRELNNFVTISSSQSSSQISSSDLPSAYDLRNVNGKSYVTPVKDQKNSGNCWAFASIAALESFLLKTEGELYDFSTNYDFSENNLKNVMSSIGRQGVSIFSVNSGGRIAMSLAYFLRWSGPISEELDKYITDNNGYVVSNTSIEFNNSEKHVQGIKYIHARNDSKDNDEIKRAIMEYGGVVTTIKIIQSYPFLYGANYYFGGSINGTDHAVCIVGWDDNYDRTKFGKDNMPPENGAFIVKNSWGSNSGDNGYYYVSYFDTSLARFSNFEINNAAGYVFTSVQDKSNYNINYHYTPFGTTYWFNSTYKSVKYRNNWVASSKELLRACGVYVDGPVNCSIEVFVNNDVEPVVKQEIQLDYAGFHTINFDNPAKLTKGQKFSIQVTLNSLNYIFFPLEHSMLVNYNGKIVYIYDGSSSHLGESEIFENGMWKDITTKYFNANLCINAYTDYYYPISTRFDVSDLTINAGENKNLVATLYDKYDNKIKNTQITVSINGGTSVVITNDNGQISFNCAMGVGVYTFNFNFNGNEDYAGVNKTITVTVNQVIVQVIPQPQPQLPVSSPTTNIPTSNPVMLTVKISKANPTYNEKITASLNKNVNLKGTVTGNSKTLSINFENGKCNKFELSKFNLKKGKSYKFNFKCSNTNYQVSQTIAITTKK